MYSASIIAAYIINWCHNHHYTITNLKLQKLLYFLQGHYYRQTKNRLITEDFYAWQLGPVIPEVYSRYAIYSASSIPLQRNTISNFNNLPIIEEVLYHFAPLSPWELVELSHQEDPWKYSYSIFGDKSKISFDSIANYFGGGAGSAN